MASNSSGPSPHGDSEDKPVVHPPPPGKEVTPSTVAANPPVVEDPYFLPDSPTAPNNLADALRAVLPQHADARRLFALPPAYRSSGNRCPPPVLQRRDSTRPEAQSPLDIWDHLEILLTSPPMQDLYELMFSLIPEGEEEGLLFRYLFLKCLPPCLANLVTPLENHPMWLLANVAALLEILGS